MPLNCAKVVCAPVALVLQMICDMSTVGRCDSEEGREGRRHPNFARIGSHFQEGNGSEVRSEEEGPIGFTGDDGQ